MDPLASHLCFVGGGGVIHQSQGTYGQPEQLSEAPCRTPDGKKQLQGDMNAGQVFSGILTCIGGTSKQKALIYTTAKEQSNLSNRKCRAGETAQQPAHTMVVNNPAVTSFRGSNVLM